MRPFRAHEAPKGRILRIQPLDLPTPRAGLEPATIRLTVRARCEPALTSLGILRIPSEFFREFLYPSAKESNGCRDLSTHTSLTCSSGARPNSTQSTCRRTSASRGPAAH